MKLIIYTINYHGHEEKCIIADNVTGTGGPDWHLVSLGGNNEILYNCKSLALMEEFIAKFNGVKKEVFIK